jgi:NAD(P)-dependent dehydrogenase (short-subunit alcohol dehydrogenase family)
MSGRVKGKVAIVTGAAQGIGRGCAEMLAREGATVVVSDIQDAEGEEVARRIRDSGAEAIYQRADVVDESQCAVLVKTTIEAYGRLDVLVNNAGYFPRATLEETTTHLWDQVLNINLRGAFYCCKHAVPHMQARGGGSIVNIGSINGIQALPTLVAYSAAKGGLLALTRTLAGAFAPQRVRVNYIIPGWVLTEGELALQRSHGISEAQLHEAGKSLMLGRHQTVEDTAYGVLYLASDESTQVTGIILPIDAGASTLPIQPKVEYPT